MRLLLLLHLFVFAYGGISPNGVEIVSQFFNNGSLELTNDIIEDSLLDVIGLITKYGYPVEKYDVVTEDGYVLAVHRIPAGKLNKSEKKTPVFLMHGLLQSSVDWIINGPGKGLGYILADEGFDVWMGNARGNYYSRNHVSLNPNKAKFWKFSWNEIGYYDLPAMIDFVLEKTGFTTLHYIGHSQGTTSFFVMCSNRNEYNKKIKSMHALAPVAYMGNLRSPLVRLLAPMSNTIGTITSLIGINEFLPSNELMTLAAHLLCTEDSVFVPVCTNILFLLAGYNPDQLNNTMLPVYMSHCPAGASSRQLIHYGQEHMSKKFRKYDYGSMSNLVNYGSISPPKYNAKLVTAPVALHYSDNDWLAEPVDVNQLFKELGNPIGKFRVTMAEFNHLDFMWGIDARKLIYNRVINLIKAFN